MTTDIVEKACSKCKEVKSLDNFYPNQRAKDKCKKQCKTCWDGSVWARYATPEYVRTAGLWQKYGLTLEDYNNLLEKQNKVCAICEQPPSKQFLYVDHCHATGRVRGLLCNRCNTALGLLNDSVELFERSIEYLESVEGEPQATRWGRNLIVPPHNRRKHGKEHYPQLGGVGNEHPRALFTDVQIKEFRRRYDNKEITSTDLAKEVGVPKTTMQAITSRRNWKHIE